MVIHELLSNQNTKINSYFFFTMLVNTEQSFLALRHHLRRLKKKSCPALWDVSAYITTIIAFSLTFYTFYLLCSVLCSVFACKMSRFVSKALIFLTLKWEKMVTRYTKYSPFQIRHLMLQMRGPKVGLFHEWIVLQGALQPLFLHSFSTHHQACSKHGLQ